MPLFYVTVTEHTYTGRSHHDVVEAGSPGEALQLAAGRAAASQPPPGAELRPDDAERRRCADVWVYSLLRCELAEGHHPPHMATAPGYRRPVRWVRDDRGLAQAWPEPASPPAAIAPATQPPSAPARELPGISKR